MEKTTQRGRVNQALWVVARSLLIGGIQQIARDAEARQQLPITETAGLLQTLRFIQQELPGGVAPDFDQAMAALADYEQRATGGVEH